MITGELKIKINALLRQLKVESPKSLLGLEGMM